jgi:coenzyme PQQ precursor peptide PqqA
MIEEVVPQSFATLTQRVPQLGGRSMTWIKPEFEIVDLCTEVTLYLYNR